MWIMDLLQAGLQTGNTQNTQNVEKSGSKQLPSALQREIRALTPGQILSGQILERNGEDLKLLVNFGGGELELQARLEQNIALSMGKNILFQVKNNAGTLSLSPLFENMGMEANAQKAIEMASLPVNDTTMQLTGLLMKEGMPVDREALQNFYREVTAYADAEIMDIIDLHKLGLEINQENLEQLHSYKNMTHQLMGGINELSGQLPQLLQEMADMGLDQGIGRLLKALLLQEDGSPAPGLAEAEQAWRAEARGEEQTAQQAAGGEGKDGQAVLAGEKPPAEGEIRPGTAEIPRGAFEAAETLPEGPTQKGTIEQAQGQEVPGKDIQTQGQENPGKDTQIPGQASLHPQNLLQRATQALSEGRELPLKELARSPEFQKQLQQYIRQELSLRPEETSKEKVDEVYSRLSRQLGSLSEALGSAGQEGSLLGRTVQNLQQNIHFLNQLNDMYSYVQLPLKMMDQDAHGELYVYTNKRKLAAREGEVSALLHLDMAHLGPMDVYVQLKESNVSTRFYLPDEGMLDFIAEHIDVLNARLEKRGYHMNCAFQMRQQQEGNTVMQELIEEQSNRPLHSDYSFDAFA